MSKFRPLFTATALLLLSGLFLLSQAQDAMSDAHVQLGTSDVYGEHLVDAEGNALYLFTNDTDGTSVCYDACAENWPPLLVEDGEPMVGEGLDETLVGTTERTDGTMQVTYNGWPLYTFVQDTEPGMANGQGANDVWFLVNAEGEQVATP
jgi:predicted lipoprotein with Yx(FWY)xxD motif